jgi:hypothetical protein
MGTNDGLLTILLLIAFMILYCWSLYASILVDIKKNWGNYKCQPLMIPLAFMFGADPSETFKECVKTTADDKVNESMATVWDNIGTLNEMTSVTNKTNQATIDSIDSVNKATIKAFDGSNKSLKNITSYLNGGYNKSRDILGKFTGVVQVLVEILKTSEKLTISLKKSKAMQKIRRSRKEPFANMNTCFYHNTPILLKDKTSKPISEININDVLFKDILVLGVLKLKKTEPFYKIKSDDNDIFVTGSHLIFNNEIDDFEAVKNHKNAVLADINEDYVYCLITSNHLIPIGNLLFHDWEDLN